MPDKTVADFCANCGVQNTGKKRFCTKCGKSLAKMNTPSSVTPPQNTPVMANQDKKRRNNMLILGREMKTLAIVVIVAGLLAIVGGIVLMNNPLFNGDSSDSNGSDDGKTAMERAWEHGKEKDRIMAPGYSSSDSKRLKFYTSIPMMIIYVGAGICLLGIIWNFNKPPER